MDSSNILKVELTRLYNGLDRRVKGSSMRFRFLTSAAEDGKSTDGADLVMQEGWSRVQFGDVKY